MPYATYPISFWVHTNIFGGFTKKLQYSNLTLYTEPNFSAKLLQFSQVDQRSSLRIREREKASATYRPLCVQNVKYTLHHSNVIHIFFCSLNINHEIFSPPKKLLRSLELKGMRLVYINKVHRMPFWQHVLWTLLTESSCGSDFGNILMVCPRTLFVKY